MKNLLNCITILFFTTTFSQVGINTTTPQAQLEIKSSNQATPSNSDGIIIPKIDAFPAINPTATQDGMMVFLTTTVGVNPKGFYYWDNTTTTWISTGGKSSWQLTGNSGTNAAINFIGTTDDQDLILKRNGYRAGRLGNVNTSFGELSQNATTSAYDNTSIGIKSLEKTTTGGSNTASGVYTLQENVDGFANTASGAYALRFNTNGHENVGIGLDALRDNQIGAYNTALGTFALQKATGAFSNVGIGYTVMQENQGGDNTIIGTDAMKQSTNASGNVSLGRSTLINVTIANDNTAIGSAAGSTITTGSNNIMLGKDANVPVVTASNQMSIANIIYGNNMGATATGNIGIRNSNPTEALDV
jgi:trimeric autotransporter adhesin